MLKRLGRLCAMAALLAAAVPAQALATHAAHHRARALHVAVATIHDDAIESFLQPAHAAPIGDVTRVPYGWADFCTRRVEECRVDVLDPVDVVMSGKVEKVLAEVNAEVNAEIEPVSNLEHWGTLLDHWDYPTDGKGDFILDNMVGEVRLWDETGYKFVKRQSQTDPNVWVSVGPATMPVTTAVVQ